MKVQMLVRSTPHAWYWCLSPNWRLWADSLFRFSWFNNTDEDMIRLIQNKLFYVPVFWPHAYGVSFKAIDASSILIPHFGIQSSLSPSLPLSLSLSRNTLTHSHQNIFLAATHAKVWTPNKTPCVSWQYTRIKLRVANSKVIRKRMSWWLDMLCGRPDTKFSASAHCVNA